MNILLDTHLMVWTATRASIGQARCENLMLMTADRDITLYQEAILAV